MDFHIMYAVTLLELTYVTYNLLHSIHFIFHVPCCGWKV